ncbi:hypothetical protein GJ496_008707 [Pomphorhynchus laevis]|nr:hypothetical protein GJ496_008707 [Pomphorhynchus laevis]
MISCNSQQIIRLQLYCILSSLLLIVPLSFTAKSKEVTIFGSLQQDLNITCPLKEIHSLIWSIEKSEYNLDRKIIRPNHKYILHRCNNCSNRIANVLQINSVTEDDERVYACYSTDKQSIKFKLQLIGNLKIMI